MAGCSQKTGFGFVDVQGGITRLCQFLVGAFQICKSGGQLTGSLSDLRVQIDGCLEECETGALLIHGALNTLHKRSIDLFEARDFQTLFFFKAHRLSLDRIFYRALDG